MKTIEEILFAHFFLILLAHMKYGCGANSGPAVCQYCDKEFTNLKKYLKLSQHIKQCTERHRCEPADETNVLH